MKRVGILIIILALTAGWAGSAGAGEARTLRVGLSTTGGNSLIEADARYAGMLVESLQEVAKYTNWRYEFIYARGTELREMMAAGELDLIAGVYYREAMEEELLYPNYVAGFTYASLVTTEENTSIQANDYRSMQGKRIAAVSSSAEAQRLLGYLALNNIRSSVLYAQSVVECIGKVRGGTADMALVSADSDHKDLRTVLNFVVEPYYIGVSPREPEALAELNTAASLILEAEPGYVDSLYEYYFTRQSKSVVKLTAAERDYIEAAEPLRMAVMEDFAPLHFAGDDGTFSGISIDILKLLEERTGLTFELLRAETIPQALEMVDSGQADAVLGIALEDVYVQEQDLIMTQPYIEMYRVALRNRYVEYPQVGLTIAMMPGMEFLIDDFTGEVKYADDFTGCLMLVNSGQADYTYGSSYFVEYNTRSALYHNVQTLTLPGVSDLFVIGLRGPVDPPLLTALNKAINSIGAEELQDIVLKNTTLSERRQTLASFIYSYPMLVIGMLSALMGVILVAAVIILLLRTRHSRALYRTQYTDELTGAHNLMGFRREASHILQGSGCFALTYASVRNFQYVNDHYGYEEGDVILRRVADAYRREVGAGEVFCRANGGAFVALWTFQEQDTLLARLRRLEAEIHTITPRINPGYRIRMIMGLYISKGPEHPDVFGMMDRANVARQRIKESAETDFSIYEEGIFDSILHAQELESRMEGALRRKEFLVYLQPKYDLARMLPCGAEALVRWMDDGEIVPPGEFIPQFERNGFIAKLDQYMFTECCALLRGWLDAGQPTVPISVNVSRILLYTPDFVDTYTRIRNSYNIPHGLLELEFTESILFDDVEELITIVNRLHENGFKCSIDDFGKGYSSLTMLKNIPVDILKLDAQFFEEGINGERDTIIVESVVEIARSLGMCSIAEGIETRAQVTLLKMLGCDMVQGYVFSRPLNVATFERYLQQKLVERKDPYAPLEKDEGTQA